MQHLLRPDGVHLAAERHGPENAPALVFAHGFGQTRGSWRNSARALAAKGWRCVLFDARGHGDSGHVVDGRYRLEDFVGDLAAICASESRPRMVVGASMGGLLALVAAAEHADPLFDALVLVDITPRWETDGVQRIMDFMRAFPDGFASYDEAAARIADFLPQRQRRKGEAQLRPLLRRGADQRLRWHWDPAMLETIAVESERHQPRLMEAARRITLPLLLVSGGRSDVVSQASVDEFLQLAPHARHVQLDDATHMVAGDVNDAFTREVEEFADTVFAPRSACPS